MNLFLFRPLSLCPHYVLMLCSEFSLPFVLVSDCVGTIFKPPASQHQLHCNLCVLSLPRFERFPIISCDPSDYSHVSMWLFLCLELWSHFVSYLWQWCIWTGTVYPRCACSGPHIHNAPHLGAVWRGWGSPGPSCWRVPGRRAWRQVRRHRGARSCSPAPGACPGRPVGPGGQGGTTAAARMCNCQRCRTGTLSLAPGDSQKDAHPRWIPQGWL